MREPLLEADEPSPVEVVNATGAAAAVLVCDHAANRVPRRLGHLGLEPPQLDAHIGWDPGAADVARRLAQAVNAPLVLSAYSRLVIDCNRPPASHQSIVEQIDGVVVPGNRDLSPAQRAARVQSVFQPYHDAIEHLLDQRAQRPTLLLSIHSFTPVLDGQQRPWHVGVSHWRDDRLAALLRRALAAQLDLVVGDNEPYPIEPHIDYTVPVHGEGRGVPSVMIELRQDLVGTPALAGGWADRLTLAYRNIETEAVGLCGQAK